VFQNDPFLHIKRERQHNESLEKHVRELLSPTHFVIRSVLSCTYLFMDVIILNIGNKRMYQGWCQNEQL